MGSFPGETAHAAVAAAGAAPVGELPEWDLTDLYPDMDGPELKRDLALAAEQSIAFEKRW